MGQILAAGDRFLSTIQTGHCGRPVVRLVARRQPIALDAKTGKRLWHYQTGSNHTASPISYAVHGRQYVALTSGNILFSFGLPE